MLTVKELIEILSRMEPNRKICYEYLNENNHIVYLPVSRVILGLNELDNFVILSDYEDKE